MEILAHLLPIKYMKEAIENVRMCDAKIKGKIIVNFHNLNKKLWYS